jgi:hypothetical protein
MITPLWAHPPYSPGGRGEEDFHETKNGRLQGSYATKENPFKHKTNDVVGERRNNCKGATNYYATLFENVESSFTLHYCFLACLIH